MKPGGCPLGSSSGHSSRVGPQLAKSARPRSGEGVCVVNRLREPQIYCQAQT
jgi:hypothetical protein